MIKKYKQYIKESLLDNINIELFIEACEKGDIKTVYYYIKKGVLLNNTYNFSVLRALEKALLNNHINIIKIIANNVDISQYKSFVNNMYIIGKIKNNENIIRYSKEFGADENYNNINEILNKIKNIIKYEFLGNIYYCINNKIIARFNTVSQKLFIYDSFNEELPFNYYKQDIFNRIFNNIGGYVINKKHYDTYEYEFIKKQGELIKESLLDKITGPDITEINNNFINGRTNILKYKRILDDAGLRISEDILNIGFKKGYIEFGLYLHYASDSGYKFLSLDELEKIDFRRTQTYHILQKSLDYGYLDGVKYVCEDIDKNEYREYRCAYDWDYNYNVLLNNLDIIKYLNGKGFLNRWNNDILLKSAILNGNHPDVLEYVLNNCEIDKTIISEIELSNPVIRNDIDTIRILMKHGYYKDREKYLNTALRYKYNDLAEIFLNESLLNKIKGPSEEEIINHLSNLSPDEMLFKSAKMNYLNGVKKAIELGANIESDKSAALYISTRNGNLEIVKYLIENGADINGNNYAAIINAIDNKHLDVVKYLIGKGADIKNINLDNLLFLGLDVMEIDIIKIALDNGAKINKINPDKFNTLLNNLYKNNEIEFLYRCIKLYGINGDYNTCYYLSCKYGYLDGVKVALEKHKINASDDFYSLKLAIKYNHLNIVKYLIERFSSTENAYKWEKAAKDYANEFNNREVLNYLLYRE